jgi:hypothetical protein
MKENRSFFFPLALIAAGSLWLLIGMGIVPSENLWALTRYWPILLIGLGLGMILSATWRFANVLMSVLLVGGAVAVVLFAPQLGWDNFNAANWSFDIDNDFGGAVRGSGVLDTETRKLPAFEAVSLAYPADVVIKQGASNSIIITAEDNLLPQLTSEIEDGVLVIRNGERDWNDRVHPSEKVEIVLTVKDLTRLTLPSAATVVVQGMETDSLEVIVSGAGDVDLEDMALKSLQVTLSGAGSISAQGTADELGVRISGFGDFKGADLQSQTAEVRISGAGDATLWVEQGLEAAITGAGSIRYYGDPRVDKSISGAGSVSGLGEKK